MARVVPGHPQGRRGGRAPLGPARSRRARPHPHARGGLGRPVQRGPRRDLLRGADRGQHRPGGTARLDDFLSTDEADLAAGAPPGRRRRHHVHLGDHRPPQRAWSCDTVGSRPPDASRRPSWDSASSPARPSPPPAGRCSCAVPCAAASAGGSSHVSTPIAGSPRSNATVRWRHSSCRRWSSSSSPLLASRRRTSRAWRWSTSAAHPSPRPLAPLRRRTAFGGDPVRVRDDRVRRGHRHAPGRRWDAPRIGRPATARGRAPDRRFRRDDAGARRGRTGGHRRDTPAALVPRGPRRHRAQPGSTGGS